MKYRKKPVVIEAVQFFGEEFWYGDREWPEWIDEAVHTGAIWRDKDVGLTFIKTLEGEHICGEGDWVIRGVKGELYPCKPDIFELTYDIVEQPC